MKETNCQHPSEEKLLPADDLENLHELASLLETVLY